MHILPFYRDLQTGKVDAQSTTYRYDDSFPGRTSGTINKFRYDPLCTGYVGLFLCQTVTSKRRSHGSDMKQAHVARYFGSSGRVPGRGATRYD
jgi:hypothetical protein